MIDDNSKHLLERIANALDRMAPAEKKINNLDKSEGFVYESKSGLVRPILEINRIPIELLQGIDSQKQTLLDNTISFANDLSANNALLWGARGTGKSSLVKAVHAEVILKTKSEQLKLVEIHREDIAELPELLSLLSNYKKYKFILLCDDLSFDAGENTYKSLKAALDGGIEGKPNNVIFYALQIAIIDLIAILPYIIIFCTRLSTVKINKANKNVSNKISWNKQVITTVLSLDI